MLSGHTALVTGSTQGCGAAIARRMAAEGAKVVVTGRSVDRGEAVAASIRAEGFSAIYVRCDVGVEADVRAAVEAAVSEFGSLTVLVNNAGPTDLIQAGVDGTVVDLTAENFEKIIRVGMTSTFFTAKYAIPYMLEAGRGAIVNIISIAALQGEAAMDAYAAAKGGMLSLTRALAADYGKQRIRVNAIAPGFIPGDAPISRVVLADPDLAGLFKGAQILPDWGGADDVAAAATWLASDEAKFVTGVVLPVDGGSTSYSRLPDLRSPETMMKLFAALQDHSLPRSDAT